MSCEETNQLLSQYIDYALAPPPRAAVEQHLGRCPVCRAHLAELRCLTRGLGGLLSPLPPASLVASITNELRIEAAARRKYPKLSFGTQLTRWLEPKLMPYTIGSFASIILFSAMFAALRPHFVALREAALQNTAGYVYLVGPVEGYDLTKPITPEDYAARRAPFAEQSPSLNPAGSLAALTRGYAHPSEARHPGADDMIVVADVFSNGSASLAGVVRAPRDRQMLADFESALRQDAAFVPASLDRRPDTMRVVFAVQKVDVREGSF